MHPPEVTGGNVASAAAESHVPDVVSASANAESNPSSAAAQIPLAFPEPTVEELIDEGRGPATEPAAVLTEVLVDRAKLMSLVRLGVGLEKASSGFLNRLVGGLSNDQALQLIAMHEQAVQLGASAAAEGPLSRPPTVGRTFSQMVVQSRRAQTSGPLSSRLHAAKLFTEFARKEGFRLDERIPSVCGASEFGDDDGGDDNGGENGHDGDGGAKVEATATAESSEMDVAPASAVTDSLLSLSPAESSTVSEHLSRMSTLRGMLEQLSAYGHQALMVHVQTAIHSEERRARGRLQTNSAVASAIMREREMEIADVGREQLRVSGLREEKSKIALTIKALVEEQCRLEHVIAKLLKASTAVECMNAVRLLRRRTPGTVPCIGAPPSMCGIA
jgi:hypothetical protein